MILLCTRSYPQHHPFYIINTTIIAKSGHDNTNAIKNSVANYKNTEDARLTQQQLNDHLNNIKTNWPKVNTDNKHVYNKFQ